MAALLTIAKTWKQPKYPSTDEWIKMCGVWEYMCLCVEYYSAIKKNEILPFAATHGPRDYHTKWRKSDRERQAILQYHLYVGSKNNTNESINKTETDYWLENKLTVTKEERERQINKEDGINRYTLLYIKQVSNKNLLYNRIVFNIL